MKKNLLTILALATITTVSAQVQKRPMIEHFTQASCGPCAGQNPTLKATLDAFGEANYVRISHQVSWPGFDPMYNDFAAGPDARVSYYAVSGVPNTSLNGGATGAPNTIVTAATLAAAAGTTTPYNIVATQTWIDANTVTVNIDVINTTGAAISSADKIYVTMVENEVTYTSAPGSNGETSFEYVMRQMYNASTGASGATTGAALASIPASGTTNFNFTITSLPTYLRDKGQVAFAVYIQNDATKVMYQAAKTPLVPIPGLINVAAVSSSTADAGYCDLGITPKITFTNNDLAETITQVVAEYSIDGGTAVQQTFNGSLANSQSTLITFPATTLSPGTSVVSYNIVSVNGTQNWQSPAAVSMADQVFNKLNASGVAAPVVEGMETATLTAGYSRDLSTAIFSTNTASGQDGIEYFGVIDGPALGGSALGGFANSNRSVLVRLYNISSGGVCNLVMQKVNLGTNSELSFNHSYCQYTSENDRLQVYVSTNCGTTWTSVFNKAGATLATAPVQTASFFPNAASQWANNAVNLSAYNGMNDVVIRFEVTSAYGNNLFLDDINIGPATGLDENTAATFAVYPNPASDKVTVELSEIEAADAQIDVIDVKGQIVSSNILAAGQSSVEVNTSTLASGVYTVRVKSENGIATERVIIK